MIAMDLAAGFAKTISQIIQIDRCIHEGDVEAKSAREATGNDRRREQSRAERVGPGGDFRGTFAPEDAQLDHQDAAVRIGAERTQEVIALERPSDDRFGRLGIIGKPNRCRGGGSRVWSRLRRKDNRAESLLRQPNRTGETGNTGTDDGDAFSHNIIWQQGRIESYKSRMASMHFIAGIDAARRPA